MGSYINSEDSDSPDHAPAFVEQTLDGDTLPGISEGEIIVIRSTRRKKNISATAKVVASLSPSPLA